NGDPPELGAIAVLGSFLVGVGALPDAQKVRHEIRAVERPPTTLPERLAGYRFAREAAARGGAGAGWRLDQSVAGRESVAERLAGRILSKGGEQPAPGDGEVGEGRRHLLVEGLLGHREEIGGPGERSLRIGRFGGGAQVGAQTALVEAAVVLRLNVERVARLVVVEDRVAIGGAIADGEIGAAGHLPIAGRAIEAGDHR